MGWGERVAVRTVRKQEQLVRQRSRIMFEGWIDMLASAVLGNRESIMGRLTSLGEDGQIGLVEDQKSRTFQGLLHTSLIYAAFRGR